MASAATINGWAEELARSFITTKTTTSKTRRSVESFTRSIRYHNFARTNQFEVHERLLGLEEKFLVLNSDELSNALRGRRVLLGRYQERWLPDVLDLLLRLSGDPLKQDAMEKLSHLDRSVPVIPTLRWSDIEAREPINRKDRIWRQPDFSDFSSDEDEILLSSTATSPASQKQKSSAKSSANDVAVPNGVFAGEPDPILAKDFQRCLLSRRGGDTATITEIQAIREVLFMVQGLPTSLFLDGETSTLVDPRFRLPYLDGSSLHSILQAAIDVSTSARMIRHWVKRDQSLPMMRVLQDSIREPLQTFDRGVRELHNTFLPGADGVASLLEVVSSIENQAVPLQAIDRYLHEIRDKDPVRCLDLLYDEVCSIETSGSSQTFRIFVNLFRAMCKAYAEPVDQWITHGTLADDDRLYFVQQALGQKTKSTLWHSWYTCSNAGMKRPPKFLTGHAERIFAAGKTQSFLKHLANPKPERDSSTNLADTIDSACAAANDTLLPFAPTLDSYIDQWLTSHLTASTSTLQTVLQHRLGLSSTLSAFSHLYLSSNGAITNTTDTFLFSKIDRCETSWNDRFLVSDLLEESFADISDIEHDRIVIHAQPSTLSELKTARLSVRVLENLAIDYVLPWPVANILLPDSLASYRRIALLLCQIRRANSVLEHHALGALKSPTNLSSSISVRGGKLVRPVREAEGVYLTLHAFITVLYAHLTSCVIGPMTARFEERLTATGTGTIDEMVALHSAYLQSMEVACLTAKNLRVLRETVLEVLDVCVGFEFAVSCLDRKSKSFDVEELVKMKRQAKKGVGLLITGLRGVARSSTSSGVGGMDKAREMLELLADRLESCGFRT